MARLRSALDEGDGAALVERLSELAASYTFDTTGLLPPDDRPEALRRARRLHDTYCAGCHDAPDPNADRPARNLFNQARETNPVEMAARLVIGVRGDALTTLANPLRDAEISALIALYRSPPTATD